MTRTAVVRPRRTCSSPGLPRGLWRAKKSNFSRVCAGAKSGCSEASITEKYRRSDVSSEWELVAFSRCARWIWVGGNDNSGRSSSAASMLAIVGGTRVSSTAMMDRSREWRPLAPRRRDMRFRRRGRLQYHTVSKARVSRATTRDAVIQHEVRVVPVSCYVYMTPRLTISGSPIGSITPCRPSIHSMPLSVCR